MSLHAFVASSVPACVASLALLLGHGTVIAQAGGIRGPSTATQGGTFEVDVASGDASVEVSTGSPGSTTSHPVPPGTKVTIPVPPVPPGTILRVKAGRGSRASIILVEVTGP